MLAGDWGCHLESVCLFGVKIDRERVSGNKKERRERKREREKDGEIERDREIERGKDEIKFK